MYIDGRRNLEFYNKKIVRFDESDSKVLQNS